MTRKVVEDMFLAEEHRCIARMGCMPKLDTKEVSVALVTGLLRRDVVLGKESEAETDTS